MALYRRSNLARRRNRQGSCVLQPACRRDVTLYQTEGPVTGQLDQEFSVIFFLAPAAKTQFGNQTTFLYWLFLNQSVQTLDYSSKPQPSERIQISTLFSSALSKFSPNSQNSFLTHNPNSPFPTMQSALLLNILPCFQDWICQKDERAWYCLGTSVVANFLFSLY